MKGTDGFSLIEVMCAILILGIGFVGLTHGITSALISSKESELQTTAALIAAGRIELLRADSFLMEGEDEQFDSDLSLYHWRQRITETAVEGLFDVEVVVDLKETGSPIYQLRTMLFDPPVSFSTGEKKFGTTASKR
jgi:prepilin-type N-terminal cleavage/methylation domain-containing protein